MQLAAKQLNIQPSEFWNMPFFAVYKAVSMSVDRKEPLSRAEILDAQRTRNERLGWQI